MTHARYLALPALALGLLVLGSSFVITHVIRSTDGARLEPGKKAWLSEGALVSPLMEEQGRFRSGDIVTAVEGRTMRAWAESLLGPAARANRASRCVYGSA